jgi:hypothetical protein
MVCFTIKNILMDDIRNFLSAIRDDGQVFFTPALYKGMTDIDIAFGVLSKIVADCEKFACKFASY